MTLLQDSADADTHDPVEFCREEIYRSLSGSSGEYNADPLRQRRSRKIACHYEDLRNEGFGVDSCGSSSTTLHDSVRLQLEQVNLGEI